MQGLPSQSAVIQRRHLLAHGLHHPRRECVHLGDAMVQKAG